MSKIGIMSMQRINNYGSFMQAYALKKIIESLGNEVEFVDYKYERTLIFNKKQLKSKIVNNINIVQFLKKRGTIKKFANIYENEFLPLLNVKDRNYNKKVDALVIGSDEVFNCLQPYPVGYSRNLFGYEYDTSSIISYAACFGHTSFEELNKYNIAEEIAGLLLRFKSISVRDKNSQEIVLKLINKKSEIHLDPVLIYDFKDRKKINVELDNYIIVYAYPGRLSKKEEKYIKNFAKKYGKKILSLGSYQSIADYIKIVNPLEIFSYFEKADFIITDTFHGSIFAIKTKANFCTIIRDSNNNKLSDLLDKLSLESRIVKKLEDIELLYGIKTDFSKTDKILEYEKKKAINYLKNNL